MEVSLGTILERASRRQLRRLRGVLLVCHLSVFCVVMGVLCAVEAFRSLPEPFWGISLSALSLSCVLSWVLFSAAYLPRRLSASGLARRIEGRHPELRDSLNCGLELERRGPLNELEAEVVASVRRKLGPDGGSYVSEQFRRGLSPLLLVSLAALLCCVAGLVQTRGGQKARCWLADRWSGSDSGLTVLSPAPGSWFTTHGDVPIRVRVNRWERSATLHSHDDAGRPVSFPMRMDDQGVGVGVLYDVVGRVRFRVTTPSLSTGWREHGVWDRPALTSVSVRTVPQAYTGLKPQVSSQLCDLGIVRGDRIVLDACCSGARVLWLRHGETRVRLSESGGLHRADVAPESTGDAWILIAGDIRGQEHELGRFTVTVRPDLPPEIERQSPPGDVSIHERDSVRLHAVARDDFGLRSFVLRYRVAGQAMGELSLAPASGAASSRRWEWNELWDLSGLGLRAGDVLTCVLAAVDNRLPRGQESRSEVFFVSVIPDVKDVKSGSQGGQEATQVDLSDLLAESKRLLRLTYDLLGYEDVPRDGLEDLLGGLGDFQLEIGRREVAILKKAGAPRLPEPLNALFMEAKDQVGKGLDQVRAGSLRESMASQERGLGALSRLVAEMMRNQAKSDKGKSGKDPGKGSAEDGGKAPKQEEDGKGGESRALSEAVENLRRLIEAQESLNRLYGRGDGSAGTELGREQRRVRHGARAVEQSLIDCKCAAAARASLSGAIGEMSGAESMLQRGELGQARLRGLRAVQGLREGLEALERAQRESNRRQVEALSRALSELSGRQRAAADVSRALGQRRSRGEDDAPGRRSARGAQESIRRDTERLRGELERASESLAPSSPEGASALHELSRQLGSDSISGGQRKAANGLLYRRYDRAAREQERVGAELSALSGRLSAVAKRLPAFSGSELRRQLARLESDMDSVRAAQRLGEGPGGRSAMSRARRRSSHDIGELGRMLQDSSLEESGRLSGGFGESSSVSESGAHVLRHLRDAVEAGARRLSELEGAARMTFRREQVYPPDKYRRLVEDYFKSLAQ